MLVPPAPILTLPLGFYPSVLSVLALAPLFHQPVAISTILVFIPSVPIAVVAIIVTVMLLGKSGYRYEKRTAQQQDCYETFHRR
jgi:hypothetical protein